MNFPYPDPPDEQRTNVVPIAVLSHGKRRETSAMTGDWPDNESTLDSACFRDQGRLQGPPKGMEIPSVPMYTTSRSHFPNDRVLDAQIRNRVDQRIPVHHNRFATLPQEPIGQGEVEEQEIKRREVPHQRSPKKARKSRRSKRRRRNDRRPAKSKQGNSPAVNKDMAAEEVSEQMEEKHWLERESGIDQALMMASMAAQQKTDSASGMLPGCQVMIAEVMMLVYLDTGCAVEGVIDWTCYKAMVAAGADFKDVPLTITATSASGHHMEFDRAIQASVTVDTRNGQREADLTFAVMKGDFALGALIGSPGLAKLRKEVECWSPGMQVLPRENGCMPRAHVLKTEALVRTASQFTVPPNSTKAVFVIGPIRRTAVGSDAIAEPGYGQWAGMTGRTLTTVRRDQDNRMGAYVLVTNPNASKSIVVPRGSPIARLDILWRRVRAEVVVPGKETPASRQEYTGPAPPLPFTALTTEEDVPHSIQPKAKAKGKFPNWFESALKEVSARTNVDQGTVDMVAEEVMTAMGDAADNLEPKQAKELATTLLRHAEVFTPIRFDKVGISDKLEPKRIILNEGARIQSFPPRRLGYARRKLLGDLVREMLKDGVIEPSTSPWSFPVVIAPKANGEPRFCIDFRRLNDMTKKDSYPLPRVDDILDRLGEAQFYSVLDLRSGFWQLPLAKEDREKTAFATPDGLFQFRVLPMGLKNSPADFQRSMGRVLAGVNFIFSCIYLDDIIVFSRTFEAHMTHLSEVLSRLARVNLKVKLAKCSFCRHQVRYLGHLVTREGIRVDTEKTDIVLKARAPTNRKELRSFLGLVNYYRKFLDNHAAVVAPLSRLTSAKIPWEWGATEQQTFDKLKASLVKAPVLAYPDPNRPIKLRTDASGYAIAGVLQQQDPDSLEWHPIGYWSRSMRASERGYSATEREGLAAVEMLKHFRPYIEGRVVDLETDAQALKYILERDSHNARLARWAIILKSKEVRICFRPGSSMGDADSLSRFPMASTEEQSSVDLEEDFELYSSAVSERLERQGDPEAEEHTIFANIIHTALRDGETIKLPVEVSEVREAQKEDDMVQRIMKRLEENRVRREGVPGKQAVQHPEPSQTEPSEAIPIGRYIGRCEVRDGMLHWKDRHPQTMEQHLSLWIPDVGDLRERILIFGHASFTSAHSGIKNTINRLRVHYFWPQMQAEARTLVSQCHSCQIRKARGRDPGQVKSIVANAPMELWAVDLVGPLVRTNRNAKYILTMMDHFSRFVDGVALCSKKATEVGQGLLTLIARHGAPRKILADKGGEFQSIWTRALHQDLRLKGISTSGYAPQTNGKLERCHSVLGNILSQLVSEQENDWDIQLPIAMFAYNTATHSATAYTPFFLNHLREAKHPWQDAPILPELPRSPKSWKTEMVQKAATVYERVRQRLYAQRDKIEQQAEALRPFLQRIQVGDLVIRKIPKALCSKLGARWRGPAEVVEIWNDGVNYKLRWDDGKVTTEHIRRLQKYKGTAPLQREDQPQGLLPGKSLENRGQIENEGEKEREFEVQYLVESDFDEDRQKVYLVQWKGFSKEERTWEPREALLPKCRKLVEECDSRERAQRRDVRQQGSSANGRAARGKRNRRTRKTGKGNPQA